MASPVGHGILAAAILKGLGGQGRLFLGLCLFLSVAPDLDFLMGLIVKRQPAYYHQGLSHSLLAALIVSLAAAFLLKKRAPGFAKTWIILFSGYTSHLILDLFGPDGRPPYGIPLFWPISNEHYLSPFQFMPNFRHAPSATTSAGEWLAGVLGRGNLRAIALEAALLTPLLLLAFLVRRGSAKPGRGRDS